MGKCYQKERRVKRNLPSRLQSNPAYLVSCLIPANAEGAAADRPRRSAKRRVPHGPQRRLLLGWVAEKAWDRLRPPRAALRQPPSVGPPRLTRNRPTAVKPPKPEIEIFERS